MAGGKGEAQTDEYARVVLRTGSRRKTSSRQRERARERERERKRETCTAASLFRSLPIMIPRRVLLQGFKTRRNSWISRDDITTPRRRLLRNKQQRCCEARQIPKCRSVPRTTLPTTLQNTTDYVTIRNVT